MKASARTKRTVLEPGRFGAELRKRMKENRYDKVYRLLTFLPKWPIREALIDATAELALLKRDVQIGQIAKVSNHRLTIITDHILKAEGFALDAAIRTSALL